MKKVVISGSSKLQDKVNYWLQHFKSKNYEILDYPKSIEPENYQMELLKVQKDFYTALENTDVYFLMNEEKNGIKGYIGAGAMSELTYVVILNLIHNKNIDIYILNMPSGEVSSYDEIKFWLDMGLIKLYKEGHLMTLKEQLENYIPFNEQEQMDKEQMLKFINNFDDVLTRDNIFGHFSASAFVVNKERTKMVVVYHIINDGWIYPGGHADGEEDLLSVAIREVEEETGLKPKVLDNNIFSIQCVPVKGHIKKGKYVSAHLHFDVLYLLEADDKEELKFREDESKGVKWIPFEDATNDEIVDFIIPTHKKIIDKLKTTF